MIISLLLFAVVEAQAVPCLCPDGIGARAGMPPLVSLPASGDQPGLIVCGDTYPKDAKVLRVSEFEVVSCGSREPLLLFSALQSCLVTAKGEILVITELTRGPFGPNWEWVDVPLWQYTVRGGAAPSAHRTLVLQAPALSPESIREALELFTNGRGASSEPENSEEIIGRVLAAALAGSDNARVALAHIPEVVAMDGHAAEVWFEAKEIYQAYACESGRVPLLPGV
jgi:hypothetical protein